MVEQSTNNLIDRIPPEKRWQPGQSGNPDGRPVSSVTTLLKNRNHEDNQAVADKLYALAIAGDIAAIREYIDRTDGKVVDKRLSITVVATPESIQAAQDRLRGATLETYELTGKCPVCGNQKLLEDQAAVT